MWDIGAQLALWPDAQRLAPHALCPEAQGLRYFGNV